MRGVQIFKAGYVEKDLDVPYLGTLRSDGHRVWGAMGDRPKLPSGISPPRKIPG